MTIEVVHLRRCGDWGKSGDVRIDRKTKWGNPYPARYHTHDEHNRVIELYRDWLNGQLNSGELDLSELNGVKRLGCWCKPLPCHGDVLKEYLEATMTA